MQTRIVDFFHTSGAVIVCSLANWLSFMTCIVTDTKRGLRFIFVEQVFYWYVTITKGYETKYEEKKRHKS